MPDAVAKTMAAITALLLVLVLAVLYVTSRPPSGSEEVVAEFRNAFPVLEGMHVRVDGAIAGSVGPIDVTDDGLASVTLLVDSTIEPPTSNATAAVRAQDTTGDSYVAYDPGDAEQPLPDPDGKPTIECDAKSAADPCANTLVAPRFDDLLNAFGPPERAGIQLLLVELAKAVDERGDDLNRAALDLRPALVSAGHALDEVNSQNSALRSMIGDAEAVTAQAADRRIELNDLIDSLATTVAATSAELTSLDPGLAKLPATVQRARSTLSALANGAAAARPLATELGDAAPELAETLRQAQPFIDDVGAVMDRSTPTLELTRELLVKAGPTIAADPQRVVTGPFDLAPAISNLFKGILGGDTTFDAFFGGTVSQRGFGAIAVEPGGQAGYPAGYDRNFLRISAVLNCEAFGVPVEPGCLAGALSALREQAGARRDDEQQTSAADGGPEAAAAEPQPGAGSPLGGLGLGETLDGLGLGGLGLGETLDGLGLNQALGGLNLDDTLGGLGLGSGAGEGASPPSGPAIEDLLDFLIR